MQPPPIHSQAELSEGTSALYVSIRRVQINICNHVSPGVPHDPRAKSRYRVKNEESSFRQARGSRTRKVAPAYRCGDSGSFLVFFEFCWFYVS